MGKHWKYFFLLLWISYLIVSGVLLFTRGFLLSRVSLTYRATCTFSSTTCYETNRIVSFGNHSESLESFNTSTLASHCENDAFGVNGETDVCEESRAKVILIIIDALRYDFLKFNRSLPESQVLPFQNKLTVVHELLTQHPNNSRLYKFIADPPTTTMQRLKAITTGSLPTFIDVGSNFATPEINEDSIIDQLRYQNKNIVFMGDDTWIGLYPNKFVRDFAYPSFNVWDLDTVDNGIRKHLLPEIGKSDWHLLIAHFLGVDHCGHRYGPYHMEMSRKLGEMNDIIRMVIDAMDDSTMLFVIGDHGMTATGDHGGDSEAEVSAAMFIYSRKQFVSRTSVPHKDIVKQVDIVPTLSTILGLPIPFSNLGSIILDALPSGEDIPDWHYALNALKRNIKQTTNYIHQYSVNKNQFTHEKLTALSANYNKLQDQVHSVVDSTKFKSFANKALDYLISVRQMCEEVWVEFDPMLMSRGLVLTFVTIFFSFLIVDRLPGDVLNTTFLLVGYISMGIAVGVCIMSYSLNLVQNLEVGIYFFTGIVSLFLISIVIIQNWDPIVTTWHNQLKVKDWPSTCSRLLIVLSLFVMFSNSYIVQEASVLSYLLLTLLWLLVYSFKVVKKESLSRGKVVEKSLFGWIHAQLGPARLKIVGIAVTLNIMLRISHYYWRCREEQSGCESFVRHKPHSSGTLVEGKYRNAECLFTLICLALFSSIARIWLRSCGNLVGFSPTVALSRYSPTVIVVCTGGFWILHSLPKDMKLKFFLPWQLQFLPWIIYGILSVAILSLFAQPLSVYVIPRFKDTVASVYGQENAIPQLFHQVKDMMAKRSKASRGGKGDAPVEQQFPIVYGLATVYSAVFVNIGVYLCLLVALLLGDVLAPSAVLMVSIGVGLLIVLAVLQYEKALVTAQLFVVPWSSVVCWGLLSAYFFYGTGHQPTFPSIQWDAAFVGTGGQFSSHFIPAVLIGINTFSSQIIMGLLLPLVLIAPFTMRVMFPKLITASTDSKSEEMQRGELVLFEKEELFYRGVFTLCTKYILFYGLRIFACMLAATVHCRHLMVWKIFAPKLIFEGLGFFVTIPSVLIAYLIIIRIGTKLDHLLSGLENVQR